MDNLVNQLSKFSDTELVSLLVQAKHLKDENYRSKTNRFGLYKKLPREELDVVVAAAKTLSDDIDRLESKYEFCDFEIRKQVLEMLGIKK